MNSDELTTLHEEAAQLLAEGRLTQAAICERVSISPATLARWKNAPEFSSLVEKHRAAFRAVVRMRGLAILECRVDAANDRWLRLLHIIEERAADPTMAKVPGGQTGLLIRKTRRSGTGETSQEIEEYVIDFGLLKELRELETQAALELGSWDEDDGGGDKPVLKGYITLGPEHLRP